MFYRAALLGILLLAAPLLATEPSKGPRIEDYGPTYPINDRDVPLPEGFTYKAVFDLAAYPGEVTAVNVRLESVARFLNMHGRNGVPAENMDLAIVVHGAAVKNLLNNDAYEARYKVENPNLELLTLLRAAAVSIYVCGQSTSFSGVDKNELADGVQVALSAMTMLTVLQSDGYALLP
ncbi:MAG: DsrE family protein [Gammaproteobacteria bacterium]|jgi:intracellular sulfur oxidation DsrE/DsrF family protein|nr:DsrE family protein [Gammaproteobacteria bacterium]